MVKLHRLVNLSTYSLLSMAGAAACLMPTSLGVFSSAQAANPATGVELSGVVRDFPLAHGDFDVVPDQGFGHYAGNVLPTLGAGDVPTFAGFAEGDPIVDFNVVDGEIIPDAEFAYMVTVLGASISSGGLYDLPVTFEVNVATESYGPFGPAAFPVLSNVNTGVYPQRDVREMTFNAGRTISVRAASWQKARIQYDGTDDRHWVEEIVVDSATNSPQVKLLRDGDAVPTIAGFDDQASIADYVADYIDSGSDTMSMGANQVIMLFELGTTFLSGSDADFQDLVLLITLGTTAEYLQSTDVYGQEGTFDVAKGSLVTQEWRHASGTPVAPHLALDASATVCGANSLDTIGALGANSSGGIISGSSFATWFTDVPGINLSMPHSITLMPEADGVYSYTSDSFFPADGMLFGNEAQAHNTCFTYSMAFDCTYRSCEGMFVEIRSTDDAWLFIGDQLAIDLGGVRHGTEQRVDLDRLNLTDGDAYELRLFIAQRNVTDSEFHIRTNLFLLDAQMNLAYTAAYD